MFMGIKIDTFSFYAFVMNKKVLLYLYYITVSKTQFFAHRTIAEYYVWYVQRLFKKRNRKETLFTI